MSVLDWWCFELLIAFSGFYDVHSQAACVLMLNLDNFMYYMFIGLGSIASSIVG